MTYPVPRRLPRPYVRIQAMSDTIGARLRQARELRKLTLQQVSETTKVRTHYLHALESDDYSAIPSAAQARGFLRIYSEFLRLDLSGLMAAMEPAPAPAAPDPSAATPAAQPARPSLWSGLRERLARRPGKDAEVASLPAGLSVEPVQPPDALPASSDVETTRRAKPASQDVKKNAT